jgi:hypothetical protein
LVNKSDVFCSAALKTTSFAAPASGAIFILMGINQSDLKMGWHKYEAYHISLGVGDMLSSLSTSRQCSPFFFDFGGFE